MKFHLQSMRPFKTSAQYNIEGEGFVWSHNTMDSLEAMDQIDRVFLTRQGIALATAVVL